jgi:phage/plasmid-associated DNA primase
MEGQEEALGIARAALEDADDARTDDALADMQDKTTMKAVYERYEEWCEEGGERAESKRKFNARLTERGQFADRRSGPGGLREWHGLRLLTKENAVFAGKLTERPEKSYKQEISSSRGVNVENSVSSSVTSVTAEQEARIAALMRKGFAESAARAEVLAADHPVGCGCEVCL